LGSRRAATGGRNDRGARPQAVEDHDRRSRHRRPLTWGFSRVFPGPQYHTVPCRNVRYRSRTEEARGSNPLTSTPKPCRSERRQPQAGDAHCMLRPRCGRNLTSQCSREGSQRQATRPKASHHDHPAWSPPPAGRRAILRASSLFRSTTRSKRPLPHHRPRRSRPSTGPARPAPASSARLQPRADDAPSWTRRATMPTPGHPSRTTACPTATLHDLIPVGHSGRWKARTPDVHPGRRGRTLDTWTLRHPHRTPISWTGTRWTLSAPTGHRRRSGLTPSARLPHPR
jgi:hypothetical protein